jgi:hypothetical protein
MLAFSTSVRSFMSMTTVRLKPDTTANWSG